MTDVREDTRTAGAEMADGSNAGKEVAAPRGAQLSPVMRERAAARDNMLADVDANRGEIAQFLAPFGVDFDFFRSGLRVFLMRQMQTQPDFFTSVSAVSFMEALFRIAMNGLIPDGKEAAIGVYKGAATALFMRDGFVKVLWRTGQVKSINDGTVTKREEQEGRFEYVEGDDGYVKHRPSLDRTDADEVVAAYCVIQMAGGGTMREVVTKSDLEKIRKMSRSPARKEWAHQMDRKAAIRRIMGKMPREKGVAQLLQHDEAAYDLTAVATRPVASGVRARLEQGADATRPGFAPGHAEQQLNPLGPERLDEVLGGDNLPGAPRAAAAAETGDEPSETQTPASEAPSRPFGDASDAASPSSAATPPALEPGTADGTPGTGGPTSDLGPRVDAYIAAMDAAKHLTSLRAARQRAKALLDELKTANPERYESIDRIFNRRYAELETPPQ